MIGSSLLTRVTAAPDPVDTNATVTIRPSRNRLLWRLACAIAMTIGAAYGLIAGALSYADYSSHSFEPPVEDVKSFVKAYSAKTVADVVGIAERTRDLTFHVWPVYAFGITTLVLVIGLFGTFRIFTRLQSAEPSAIIGPTGIRLLHDVSRRSVKTIPWSSIAAVRAVPHHQNPSVILYVSDPTRFLEPRTWLQCMNPFASEPKTVIRAHSLDMRVKTLKALLDAYLAANNAASARR